MDKFLHKFTRIQRNSFPSFQLMPIFVSSLWMSRRSCEQKRSIQKYIWYMLVATCLPVSYWSGKKWQANSTCIRYSTCIVSQLELDIEFWETIIYMCFWAWIRVIWHIFGKMRTLQKIVRRILNFGKYEFINSNKFCKSKISNAFWVLGAAISIGIAS